MNFMCPHARSALKCVKKGKLYMMALREMVKYGPNKRLADSYNASLVR